jgi:hypothetical protein
MCTKFEMKFNHGLKSMDFKMEGYSEETSMNLVNSIMNAITESGNSKSAAPKIETQDKCELDLLKRERQSRVFEWNNVVRNQKEEAIPQEETITDEQATIHNSTAETHQEETSEDQETIFNPDNETHQTYYICKCGDKGKHKIKRSQIYVNCWKCGKRMRVRDAHIEGFPMKDSYGNTFIAGEFKRSDQQKYGAMVY